MSKTVQQILPHNRQASILFCVLACMVVAMALVVSTTRSALRARREVRTLRQLRQVELVLEAGIQRAARQLTSDAEYRGEIWTLSPTATAGLDSAQVEIEVSSIDGVRPRQVKVVVRLPAKSPAVIQRSYT
ncbi:MAG: hypothetical protein IH898_13990, partial [Planctomycetes bacterium]|nr:hypothetical protein [Planctomycetota bacterium]